MPTITSLQRTAALICCYSSTKDYSLCLPVSFAKGLPSLFLLLFTKDRGTCLLLVICKLPQSLISAICSQRAAVLVYLFHLQRSPYFPLLFTKDRGPCLLLFICKGLRSLSSAIYLQRTAVLDLCFSFAKDCCPCLVLFICKGLLSLSCDSFAKGCGPCLVLFICKGLRSLS